MTLKDKLELANWVMTEAQKAGAEQVGVDISKSRDININVREGKIDKLNDSTANSLTLAVYAGNRYSSHTTNDMRRESLKDFISKALTLTAYLGEDPYRRLLDGKYYEPLDGGIDLQVDDGAYEKVDSSERVLIARAIEDAARRHNEKVISCSGEYGDTYYESVKTRSNGFAGESHSTRYYVYSEASVDDGTGGRPDGECYVQTRRFADLGDPVEVGRRGVEDALQRIGQKKIASGRYAMIIENRSARRLMGMLISPLSGGSLQQRRSFLEGKLGERIGADPLTLIDDPHVPGGMGSQLFDDEGMTARRRVLIEGGILKSYLIGGYYARKLGVEPTGGGTSNLIMAYGSRSPEQMIGDIKKGIWVTGFLGGNSNSTSGDFSVGIIGQYIENGVLVHPVNEMNISGNLADIFSKLVEVGNDPYTSSSWRLPTLSFADIDFSGV